MSEENVQLVRRIYAAITSGDDENVRAAYDPEVVMDFSRSPVAGVLRPNIYQGHAGLRAANEAWYEAWGSLDYEPGEFIDGGDQVVCAVTVRGRGRASGATTDIDLHAVWTIEDGRVVRVDWLTTREEALEAAGLSE